MNSCDILLTNATILTMDDDFHVLAPGMLAVTGDHIVAVGDAALAGEYSAVHTIDCGGQVLLPGLRALCGQTVLKFPTPDAGSNEDSLAAAREFIVAWKGHSLIVPAVSPHAPYTCTPEILQACAALAQEFDVPLHTHFSETLLEVENSRREL